MDEDEIEIPQYFICPISLQIMKDPVTTVSGITYDRESIEKWLATIADATCPVTKQPLPRDSDLTPNHMLRRIIQAWCVANAKHGIDRIPTPKSPLTRAHVLKLIRDLRAPQTFEIALEKMDELAAENGKNRGILIEAGAANSMIMVIMKCFREKRIAGLEEAFRILHLIWSPTPEIKQIVRDNIDLIIQSVLWVLRTDSETSVKFKAHAIIVLKLITESATSSLLERLKPDFFKEMVNILSSKKISAQAIKAALQVLIQVCPLGRNRMKIIESGAVFELIELELGHPEKRISEFVFCLLGQLCSVADGRAQLLGHAGGIAVVAKRLLRVSQAADDRAVNILGMIARFSATKEVLLEMMKVGAVAKLCMVLQADCEGYLKKQAREILRLHSSVWNNSPCIQIYLLTRNPR